MDTVRIRGGTPLTGTVTVGGSKNAALPILAASLMAEGPVVLKGVPCLSDVRHLCCMLQGLGMRSPALPQPSALGGEGWAKGDKLELVVSDGRPFQALAHDAGRLRASLCLLGPLLARRGRAQIQLPGGCRIGSRPFDLHLTGLATLGARIRVTDEAIEASADHMRGAEVDLKGPWGSTVTGTCNVLCAATLAHGRTVIRSAAREPEVVELGSFLIAMGARIQGLGTSEICVDGVRSLTGATYQLIPDRIEAATLLIAAAVTEGQVVVRNARADHLTTLLKTLQQIGVSIRHEHDSLHVERNRHLVATRVVTGPYPGIPTDIQPPLTALLCNAHGTSIVEENVFPDRFNHLGPLRDLGAQVDRCGNRAWIRGPARLHGTTVNVPDLRTGAALVIAALMAEGETILHGAHHLDRGYVGLARKLRSLGAQIQPTDTTALLE